MAITKLQPFNLDTTANYTFANITTDNANLGNTATANFFIGSGNNLSNISGSNVSGQVGNSLVAGTVYTNEQPNITSVGTLTSLVVTGNTTSGNLIGSLANGNSNVNIPSANGNINFTAVSNTVMVVTGTGANISGTLNVTGQSNLGAVGNVVITGGTNGYVLSTDGSGALSWVAQSGGGGGGSSISNGNSNVNIPTANGNINLTAVGNTNMIITGTGINVAGYANFIGNLELSGANVNLGNVSNLHIDGGTGGYVLQTDGLGNLAWVAQSGGGGGNGGGSNIANGNSNVNIGYFNGNVTTSVNGNANIFVVTDVGAEINGTFTSNGNAIFTGANVDLGNISNLSISGGSNGFVLSTDGSGDLSWVAQPANPGTAAAVQEFSATAAQTTFTVIGGYNVGSVIVFVNGIQMNDADYTATNSSTVVLTEPRVAGDVVRILSSMISPAVNVSYLQNFSVAMSIALGI